MQALFALETLIARASIGVVIAWTVLGAQFLHGVKVKNKNNLANALFQQAWSYFDREGGEVKPVQTKEGATAKKIVELEDLAEKIAATNSQLFNVEIGGGKGKRLGGSALGKRVFRYVEDTDFEEVKGMFPVYVLNPIVERFYKFFFDSNLILEVKGPQWRWCEDKMQGLVDRLNAAVCEFRKEVNGSLFKNEMKNYLRGPRENCKELQALIDSVFRVYAKVVVVRLDLGYKKEKGWPGSGAAELALCDVKKHREFLLRKLKLRIFKDSLISYAWKLEYGPLKGYHYHFLFLLDGSRLRQDVVIGKIIGDCWSQDATEGTGLYYNCNAFKSSYKSVGIGLIDYRDVETIRVLKEKVITYMTKADFYMKFASKGKCRSFGKGAFPKAKKSAVGRPRNGSPL